MKVVLVNGSPNEKGCTYTALEVAAELERQGVEAEIVHIGKKPIRGCLAAAAAARRAAACSTTR